MVAGFGGIDLHRRSVNRMQWMVFMGLASRWERLGLVLDTVGAVAAYRGLCNVRMKVDGRLK